MGSRENSELRKQRRRLSTRKLGAFVAAASAPTAAMMMTPGTAQATTFHVNFFHGCIVPSSDRSGPNRRPNWMSASGSAFFNCQNVSNHGWVNMFVDEIVVPARSVSATGLGFAKTARLTGINKAHSAFAGCGNVGANQHLYFCSSIRSF